MSTHKQWEQEQQARLEQPAMLRSTPDGKVHYRVGIGEGPTCPNRAQFVEMVHQKMKQKYGWNRS